MVNIYVLELQGKKYYVGKTNHTFQRFNQHKTGSGAKWTQKHKVKDLFAFHKDMKDSDENKITRVFPNHALHTTPTVNKGYGSIAVSMPGL